MALHGALWAYGFYERRGAVSRAISYRYFYDREERARRAYMLFEFSQGFKQANRSVFVDTYTNYYFTKRFGEEPGADEVIAPQLLDALGRVHRAAADGRQLPRAERAEIFRTALLFEQETTVGPKVREEVDKFDCPVLTAIVLRPVVRFNYFPRTAYMRFSTSATPTSGSRRRCAVTSWPRTRAGTRSARRFGTTACCRVGSSTIPLAYADGLRRGG